MNRQTNNKKSLHPKTKFLVNMKKLKRIKKIEMKEKKKVKNKY